MFWKKSISAKLLLGVLLPTMIVFIAAGVFIISEVKGAITESTMEELTAHSGLQQTK